MKKVITLIVAVGLLMPAASTLEFAQAIPARHGQAGNLIIDHARISQVAIKNNQVDWKQVNSALESLDSAYKSAVKDYALPVSENKPMPNALVDTPSGMEELSDFKVRFDELFPLLSDDVLFPITWTLKVYAPESTFSGMKIYGKKGDYKAQILGKYMDWDTVQSRAALLSNHSFSDYLVFLETDKGRGWLTSLSEDAYNFRWEDIKNKIAFELSERKHQEDDNLKRAARGRPIGPAFP